MKKVFYIFLLFLIVSCAEDLNENTIEFSLERLEIKLSYPEKSVLKARKGVLVTLTDNSGGVFKSYTDETGTAVFMVPCGVYSAFVSDKTKEVLVYNGKSSDIIITSGGVFSQEILLVETNVNRIIIKELYCGGCQMDDGSGYTRNDKYVVVYNNSSDVVEINNFSLAVGTPYNATGTNANYVKNDLIYAKEGFMPATMGIWYYPGKLTFEPYEQKVISIYGAIDFTKTYSNSVNLANKDYYVLYDEDCERYVGNTVYYPAPYNEIPREHYFKTIVYGLGSSWIFSVTSPCFFIFYLDEDPVEFAQKEENHYFDGNKSGSWGSLGSCLKIPVKNILDGIEVFSTRYDGNQKRFSPEVDGGYVWHTNQFGYTLYRNVNKQATEKLPENIGKIVYGYNLGTQDIEKGSTDISGIDAEASMKNGAHIIFSDINNSSEDFHQRKKAAIKD